MTVRIGINGFGRIGRSYLRAALANDADIEVVAVNDLTDAHTLASLLEWDSINGHLDGVSADGDSLTVQGRRVAVLAEPDPAAIRWGDVGADVVIESTGRFTDGAAAAAHLSGGGRRSSSRRLPRATSRHSSSGSTTPASTRTATTSSPTARARRTPSPRSPRCSTAPSASSPVS